MGSSVEQDFRLPCDRGAVFRRGISRHGKHTTRRHQIGGPGPEPGPRGRVDGPRPAAPLSSGSGVGTGAGAGAMSSANTGAGGAMTGTPRSGSGMMSGRGPGSPMDRGTALPLRPGAGTVPFGPGVDVSFPTDPYLLPFLLPEEAANPLQGKAPSRVTADLLENARKIADPAERSLALRQIANGAIASNQMVLAHHTLEESITAVLARDRAPGPRPAAHRAGGVAHVALRRPAPRGRRESEHDRAARGGPGRRSRAPARSIPSRPS